MNLYQLAKFSLNLPKFESVFFFNINLFILTGG